MNYHDELDEDVLCGIESDDEDASQSSQGMKLDNISVWLGFKNYIRDYFSRLRPNY
jgi:hypothetical protein